MARDSRSGRPRASSRETLAEAACELYLEQGYERTSIADIATRAGVSRSSFFNYFSSKGDVLWAELDERIAELEHRLAEDEDTDAPASVRSAIIAIASGFAPDPLALAFVNSGQMGVGAELVREGSLRRARIAAVVADRLVRGGAERLFADIQGAAWSGAVLAAIEAWARAGAGRTSLEHMLDRAATIVAGDPRRSETTAARAEWTQMTPTSLP